MITPEKLYAATNDGLEILALHYKDVKEAARTGKPFKARPGERTPSANAKLYTSKQGFKVWKVTDFGDKGCATDPIAVHMDATGLRFSEAVLDLAGIFNVTDEINRAVNRPDVRKAPATADQADGSCFWDIDQEFTNGECAVMGPRVTPEHLKALHWYRVNFIASVRNRETTYKYSNERYPIFMRECWFTGKDGKPDRFFKVYEPLNPEKQWRFQYQPKGKKPERYTNGLFELAAAWAEFNEREEKLFFADPANEGKPYKEKKLPEAFICSGERDSLCVRSLGYHPLWFNSESYRVSEEEWKQINRYVERVYNIPDIDATGLRKGTELALRFIDLHTIWLPEKLSQYRDNRGKPRKDFRDWMEIYKENSDFRKLMELATPARFWTKTTNKKTGEVKYGIDICCLQEFLRLTGIFALHDEHCAATKFVRVSGHIVEPVTTKNIRDIVSQWAEENGCPRELRNAIKLTPYLSATYLDSLQEINPDFSSATRTSQFFHFPKFSVEVTPSELVRHDGRSPATGHYVWDSGLIRHNISLRDPAFEITHPEGKIESGDFSIRISDTSSSYFRFLINSSRIYWRQELEYGLAGLPPEEAEAYRREHRFDIAGLLLSEAQRAEQAQCLISKIFAVGYMMHRFKSPERAWAPFAMDNIIGENDQCNGRSGKSFMFVALSKLLNCVKLSGRNPKLMENPFVFEQVSRHTDVVLVDDCAEYLPIKEFYDTISMDMTVNAKNVASYTLPFEESPKFAFTTNYVPKEFNQSSRQRMLYLVFSDYYHQRTEENDYLETRQIRDDFGKALFTSEYTEAEWEADINFIMQCVRFYLSVSHLNVKIEPRLDNIIFRKHMLDMSDNFKEWAEYYFAEGGGNTDREVVREEAFAAYKSYSGVQKITMQKFTKSLRAFVYTCDYLDELNPADVCNSGPRILRRVENPFTHTRETKEMIYLRSKAEAERLRNPPPRQEQLPLA